MLAALIKDGKFNHAEAAFSRLQKSKSYKPDKDLIKTMIHGAIKAENWSKALSHCDYYLNHFPNDIHVSVQKVTCLNSLNRFEDAYEFYEKTKKLFGDSHPLIPSMHVDILLGQGSYDEALSELEKGIDQYPDNLRLQIKSYSLKTNSAEGEELDRYLDELRDKIEEFPQFGKFRQILAKGLIRKGDLDSALSVVSEFRITDNMSVESLKLLSWYEATKNKDLEKSRDYWNDVISKEFHRSIHPDISLSYISEHPLEVSPNDIIVFCTIKNEYARFPFFLDYYRKLGVDKFFICDNNSDDGGTEYLLGQEDVYVFHTTDNYALCGCGMRWVNDLVEHHTSETNWCMFVDPDEFIVFPKIESSNLRSLTDYMDVKGFDSFFAFMLDMYPENKGDEAEYEIGTDPLFTCPYFDKNYSIYESYLSPYQRVFGGFRSRIFSEKEGLTKTPIVRGGGGIKFIHSSHVTTPSKPCDVTGVLLHFKFLGNVKKVFNEAARSDTRYKSGRRYIEYAKLYSDDSQKVKYLNQNTLKYRDSAMLEDLDLITSNREFEQFIEEKSKSTAI